MLNNRITVRLLGNVVSALGKFKEGDLAALRLEDAQPLLDSKLAEKATEEAKPKGGKGK